jgi:hypothetical protein
LVWAIWRESRNDHMASGLDRLHELLHIRRAVSWIGQEVKDGAVMPDVISLVW